MLNYKCFKYKGWNTRKVFLLNFINSLLIKKNLHIIVKLLLHASNGVLETHFIPLENGFHMSDMV